MKKGERKEPEETMAEMASYAEQYLKPVEIDLGDACISASATTKYCVRLYAR